MKTYDFQISHPISIEVSLNAFWRDCPEPYLCVVEEDGDPDVMIPLSELTVRLYPEDEDADGDEAKRDLVTALRNLIDRIERGEGVEIF